MTDGENVAARAVLDIVRSSVRAQELQSADLVAIFEELLPAFLEDRGGGRREEIVEAPTDDVFALEAEEFTRADAGFLIVAVIVGDEDGRRRVKDDGAEEGLEFAESVFHEPRREGNLRLRHGLQGSGGIGMWMRRHSSGCWQCADLGRQI
jgi:hypothetical protein